MAREEGRLLRQLVVPLPRRQREEGQLQQLAVRLPRRLQDADMIRTSVSATAICLMLLAGAASAQSQRPDFTGVWGAYRAARGADSRLGATQAAAPVLKAPYAKPYEERRAAQQAATQRGEPGPSNGMLCVPYGVPTMMSVAGTIYPVEFIQTPKQITIISEAFSEVRRIYLDKPQLKIDEVPPGYYGRSVGRWEGDTLVVDTVGIKEAVQYNTIPHSDQMRITERIRLAAPNILHDEITIEDPVVLEKPITYRLAYSRLADYEMVEFICDNNREYVDANGVVRMRTQGK
jgi:hypothetical protein